jgi:ribosomal protein S18 acetylase RimI-like enzyme
MTVGPDEQVTIRKIDLEQDLSDLSSFDASFETDRIYQLEKGVLTARFSETRLEASVVKRYDLSGIEKAVQESCLTAIVRVGGVAAAFMTVKHEVWNNRSWLTHLYVAPQFKRRGFGRELIELAIEDARSRRARGLWLETQNHNYPAIIFYLRYGFQICGFDEDLYNPNVVPGETAMYFGMKF